MNDGAPRKQLPATNPKRAMWSSLIAIASFLLGLACCYLFGKTTSDAPSVVYWLSGLGLVSGLVALHQRRRYGARRFAGKSVAIAGVVLSSLALSGKLSLSFVIRPFEVKRVAALSSSCQKNMKLIQLFKILWATENIKPDNAEVDAQKLDVYLPRTEKDRMFLIKASKGAWKADNNKPDNAEVDAQELDVFLKGAEKDPSVILKCPQGGEYTYGTVGVPTSCSIHGRMEETRKQ